MIETPKYNAVQLKSTTSYGFQNVPTAEITPLKQFEQKLNMFTFVNIRRIY